MHMDAPDLRRSSVPGGSIQAAVSATTAVLLGLYRSFFEGPVAVVVPEHTRDACFQLLCDLRANTPKDRRFLHRHARALMPRTAPGWLALASSLGFGLSGLLGLACTALALSIGGLWAVTGLAISASLFLGTILSVLGLAVAGAALTAGAVASGAFMMYMTVAATLACLRMVARLLLGTAKPPAPAIAVCPALPASNSQPSLNSQPNLADASKPALPAAAASTSPAVAAPASPAPATPTALPADGGSSLSLPPIKTKSPAKPARGDATANGSASASPAMAPGSPLVTIGSPRKVNPAAAAAASMLSEPTAHKDGFAQHSNHGHAPVVVGPTGAAAAIVPSPFNHHANGPGSAGGGKGPSPLGRVSFNSASSKNSSNSNGDGGSCEIISPVSAGAPQTPPAAIAAPSHQEPSMSALPAAA